MVICGGQDSTQRVHWCWKVHCLRLGFRTISSDVTKETKLLEHRENQLKILCRIPL
jgi:hypothetical protein